MTNYTLDDAPTLLRDVRLSAELNQRELADKLFCKTPLIYARETKHLNLSLGIIAGVCRACGHTLQIRIADQLCDIGPATAKASITMVGEVAAELGYEVTLVTKPNRGEN